MSRAVRIWWGGVGVALVAVALPLASRLSAEPAGRRWWAVLDAFTTGRPGLWRALRGGLAFAAIPLMIVALAALLWFCARRSRRHALVYAGIALGANVGTQLVKHAPFGLTRDWPTLNPLSGHVGVAGGLVLGWLVVGPRTLRRPSTLLGGVLVAGVSAGVILASWHSPYQVLCPLLISSGCAVVGRAVLDGSRGSSRQLRGVGYPVSVAVLTVAAVGAAVVVAEAGPALGAHPGLAVIGAVGFAVAGSGACVTLVAWVVRRTPGLPDRTLEVPGRRASDPSAQADPVGARP